jgi:2-polyprenyl-3-methyl-5-hydroxy-6-metoxy-1,4-benzoquinol methylase
MSKTIIDAYEIEEDPFFAMDLAQMAKARNYMAWQFQLIKPYLGRSILEIGGGIGNFTTRLADCADQVISIEPNQHCFAKLVEKTAHLNNVTAHHTTAEDLADLIPEGYKADTIVCMNVLEHLKDDVLAINTFCRYLKSGGNLVLINPAVPWIFGVIDRKLGHYRRYSKQSTLDLLAATGLKPVELHYFNFIGVWAWWWNARVAKAETQSNFQIKFFDKLIVPIASRLEALVPLPVGQSLLVVAEK